jgi:hypothetical protein
MTIRNYLPAFYPHEEVKTRVYFEDLRPPGSVAITKKDGAVDDEWAGLL